MLAVGDRLDDKYRVLGRLGGGGFGDVYLAEDEAIPGRRLALKLLNAAKSAGEETLVREMQVLAKFSHPGIVAFLHHFRHAGRLVLVMAYCAGGSLEDRLAAGARATVDEAFRWGGVLCEALALVHAQGIVHHDIKPANVLFDHDGAILLGDFGVANLHAGTPLYMAPETLLGEAVSRLDPRVDVYALALTLAEAITGELPFERLDRGQWLRAKCAHQTVPAGLPRWAEELLLRATHPKPELRFQTVADFAEAIRSRHVPHTIDSRRLKAHAAAQRAEQFLARKKWKPAQRLTEQALLLYPDSTPALLAAGRCQLLLRRTHHAKAYFDRVLQVSPRIHVQKELGWLNLELGNLPLAISLLSDHLDREPSDEEACNLLMRCYWVCGRYELGENLARVLMEEVRWTDACFRNNRFLCRLLQGGFGDQQLAELRVDGESEPFLAYNLNVARESPRSWSAHEGPALKDKLIFQEFRFRRGGRGQQKNNLSLRMPGCERIESSAPVISLGSLAANDVVVDASDVSRRHAVIVNLPDEVWLYDLGSTHGTRVDGEAVNGRRFLDGVHRIALASREIEVGAHADLLV